MSELDFKQGRLMVLSGASFFLNYIWLNNCRFQMSNLFYFENRTLTDAFWRCRENWESKNAKWCTL